VSDADLEIGLRWDDERGALYANLRFDTVGTNMDEWEQPREPVDLDLERLRAIADPDEYGKALAEMVLRPDDIGGFYRKAVDYAAGGDYTLHLRLHIDAPPHIHAVRWETLRDPETDVRIATQPRVLMSRYLSSPDWRPIPARLKEDLRGLVVVAAPSDIEQYQPQGRALAPVDVDAELERADAAIRHIPNRHVLARRADASYAGLEPMLAAIADGVDVIYLICHGALADDVPRLYLEAEDGTADVVDGRKLVERLAGLKRRPTIMMLSSCQSSSRGDETWTDDEGDLAGLGRVGHQAAHGGVKPRFGELLSFPEQPGNTRQEQSGQEPPEGP